MSEIIERRQPQARNNFALFGGPALLKQQFAADDVRLVFSVTRVLPPEMLDLLCFTHDQVGIRTLLRKAGESCQRRFASRLNERRVPDQSDAFEVPLESR